MRTTLKLTKPRNQFGHQLRLSNEDATVLAKVPSRPELAANYVRRDVTTVEYSTVPSYSFSEANTTVKKKSSSGITHTEGGWSAEVDATNSEQTSRLRKRFTKDVNYPRVLVQKASVVDYCANQNNTIDIYEQYFGSDSAGMTQAHLGVHELAMLTDPTAPFRGEHRVEGSSRGVTDVRWSPTQPNVLAAAYSNLSGVRRATTEHLQSFLWDIRRSNAPAFELLPSSPIRCLAYGSDGRYLLAGTINGLISIFDPRAGSHAAKTSSIEHSHNDPVCDIRWMQSKSGTECASVSSDGVLYYWDTRKLDKPTEMLRLFCPALSSARVAVAPASGGWSSRAISASSAALYSGLQLTGCSMEDHVAAGHQKLLVGTEQGIVLMCNQHERSGFGGGLAVGGNGGGDGGGEGGASTRDGVGRDVDGGEPLTTSAQTGAKSIDSRISGSYMGHFSSVH